MFDAIVLWTRAVSASDEPDSIELFVQMSAEADFSNVILERQITAERRFDYTIRVFVDGLQPDRWYFYRFATSDGAASVVGRTRTAPAPDARKPLNAAVFSCQHYETGRFQAYRQLIQDDNAAGPNRKIDLIVHLGDFIYDNTGVPVRNQNGAEIALKNADGSPRRIGALPSGGAPIGRHGFLARTLEDYRHIYRVYLSDPDLQAARARFPFVCVWDDHEVRNDYWQSFHASGPLQRQKTYANQAWFEYIPAALSRAPDGPGGPNQAKDFSPAQIDNVPEQDFDDDFLSRGPNNLAAIGTMTIFRTLRWGRTAELILLDERSYRGPRGFDQALLDTGEGYPAAPVPPRIIETQNAGRTANGGSPPETIHWRRQALSNTRKDSPAGSMLGAVQKAWLKNALKNSGARWKVVCNSVPFMRCGFDSTFLPDGVPNGIMWTDSWDGYPIERRELMRHIDRNAIANVVSLAGDRHAHYAGLIYDDYDGPNPKAVIPEIVVAGVSATSRMKLQAEIFHDNAELRALAAFDGEKAGYPYATAPSLNAWILFGAEAARKLHDSGDADAALARAKPEINPHMVYADTDAYGYFILRITRNRLDTEFITTREPLEESDSTLPLVRRRVRLGLKAWRGGGEPKFADMNVEGEPPLLGVKWKS